jgi:hypothetical protein
MERITSLNRVALIDLNKHGYMPVVICALLTVLRTRCISSICNNLPEASALHRGQSIHRLYSLYQSESPYKMPDRQSRLSNDMC